MLGLIVGVLKQHAMSLVDCLIAMTGDVVDLVLLLDLQASPLCH
jgi:hypothetical protein